MITKYDTVDESRKIKQFLIDKKDLIKFTGLANKSSVSIDIIYNLIRGTQETLSPEDLRKLSIVLEQFGYTIYCDYIDAIIKEISILTGVSFAQITNCTRQKEVIRARQYIVMVNEWQLNKLSTTQLGNKLGDRDHSSMSHTKKTAIRYLQTKDYFFMEFWPKIEDKFEINTQKLIEKYECSHTKDAYL